MVIRKVNNIDNDQFVVDKMVLNSFTDKMILVQERSIRPECFIYLYLVFVLSK